MKKIILPFDGTNFSEGGFEFARRLNEAHPILLTGVFLPQVDYASLWSYADAASAGAGTAYVPLAEDEDAEVVHRNIERLKEQCTRSKIALRIHKDVFDFALPELKKESRFADLMIIGSELFYKGVMDGHQFDYLSEALRHAECPVILVPEHYEWPNHIILAYDGSQESLFAIKQFAYLFPELTSKDTILVYASSSNKEIPSFQLLKELVTIHYPNTSFESLEVENRKDFADWLHQRKNSILVSGSFGRSGLSMLFKRSFVTEMIKTKAIPVFIAHT